MKKLKDFELTEKQWRHVKACFVEFFKTHHKCSDSCPMFWGVDDKFEDEEFAPKVNNEIRFKKGGGVFGNCICQQFKEFIVSRRGLNCPCKSNLGSKSFVQLEKLIKRWVKEEEIKL